MCELVLSYYYVLRSVLRSRSEFRRCVSRCCHCGIFFITHPRNAKRLDLRCPFGCRAAHRRQRSTERSVAYYRTAEGKSKKRLQNDKRRPATPPSERDKGAQAHRPKEAIPSASDLGTADAADEGKRPKEKGPSVDRTGMRFGRGMLLYLAMLLGLIEGYLLSMEEIAELLVRVMRQHSIARRRRMDYVIWQLNKNPP